MYKLAYILFFSILWCTVSHTQTVLQPKEINYDLKGIVYKKEWSLEGKLHTNGFALALNLGEIRTYYKTRYYKFELGMIKHPAERKQNKNVTFPGEGTSDSFIFGKQNSLYVLRGGIGTKRLLSEKTKRKGVAVGINYEGGLSLGLLKPYHLQVVFPASQDIGNELRTIAYSEETRDNFLSYNEIFGGTGFFTGIGNTSLAVGGHGKLAAHFAFGAFDKLVKAVEMGIMVDVYAQNMPIMVEREGVSNNRLFLHFYVSAQFGRRQ